MKTLPLWKGLIEDKAILIAVIAESIYKVAFPRNVQKRHFPHHSPVDSFDATQKKAPGLKKFLLARFRELHPVSKTFIFAELLDLLTTMVGLLVIPGIWEANPIVTSLGGWVQTLLFKSLAVIVVVTLIERMRRPLKVGNIVLLSGKPPKAIWIIPIVAAIPALWNNLVIILELIS